MTMRRRMKEDNRGIALISVMICVMLSFLLSATIMRVSLLSYLQKGIAKQATSTFYENETFVDDIKLGVQQKVAMAFANSSSTSQANFLANFKSALLAAGTGGTEKAQLESALAGFIHNTDTMKVVSVTVEGEGGVLFKPEGEGEYVIKNVRIEYTDNTKDGYVSNIKTDIRIRSPFYVITTSNTSGGYSMFAGGGFTINPSSTAKPCVLHMKGDIYIGFDNSDSRKTTVSTTKGSENYTLLTNAMASEWVKDACVQFESAANVTINGDVYVRGHSRLVILSGDVDVRGKIYVSSTSCLIVSTSAKLTCQDIVLGCSDSSSYSGGDSISDGYDLGNTDSVKKVFTKLPETCDSHDKDQWWTGSCGGLYLWDGSKAERVYKVTTSRSTANAQVAKVDSAGNIVYGADGKRVMESLAYEVQKVNSFTVSTKNRTAASVSCINLKTMNYPDRMVSRTIDGTTYNFDVEFVKLVDVEYYIRGTKGTPSIDGASKLTNHPTNSDGSKWNAPYTTTSGDGRWRDIVGQGLNIHINTMVGYVEIANSGSHFFMPSYGSEISFNDQNTNQNCFGVYISPGKMVGTAKEGNAYISSLLSLVDDHYDTMKAYFDAVGQTVLPGDADMKYRVVNNMFNGGIKIFYEGGGSGGGGVIVTHDEVKNKALEVVTFENWEKY